MSRINISGLSRASVLAALYNASRPQGMGFLHYSPEDMTEAIAEAYLREGTYFDYLKGRVMKIDLKDAQSVDVGLYDRDNGQGAGAKAIEALRATKSVSNTEIKEAHKEGVSAAAAVATASMSRPSTISYQGGAAVLTLGLDDPEIVNELSPAINRAVNSN